MLAIQCTQKKWLLDSSIHKLTRLSTSESVIESGDCDTYLMEHTVVPGVIILLSPWSQFIVHVLACLVVSQQEARGFFGVQGF